MMDVRDWIFEAFLVSLSFANIATLIHNASMKKQMEALNIIIRNLVKPEPVPQRIRTAEQKLKAAQRKKAWWDRKKASEDQKSEAPTELP